MKDNLTLYDILPQKYAHAIQIQAVTGILPSHTVENLLAPLLNNFHSLYPKLSSEIQKQVRQILNIYPEIAVAYKVDIPYSNKWNRFLIRSKMTKNWAWKLCEKNKSFSAKAQVIASDYFASPVKAFIIRSKDICSDNMQFITNYPARYAFAFAVILLAMIFHFSDFIIPRKSMNILSAKSMLNDLAQFMDIKELNNPELTVNSVKMGFSHSQTPQTRAFVMGFHISGLTLSKMNAQVENYHHHLSKLNSYLKINAIKKSIQPDRSSILNHEDFQMVLNEVQKIIARNNHTEQFRLGQWYAISLAVIYSENIEAIHNFFSDNNRLNQVLSSLEKSNTPAKVFEFVEFMSERSKGKSFTKNDVFLLKTKVNNIFEVL
ncbi:hypothetical protein MHK_000569 [Candidatus Magnetomorum sp. HK-1]|nr:hypothetical protein MHK_000569 [Candidatus Magnetomorum sp. HK-1]